MDEVLAPATYFPNAFLGFAPKALQPGKQRLLKPPGFLARAKLRLAGGVKRVHQFTDREREVLHLMAEGLTTKEVARRLDIGVKTAENHRGRVLAKLGLRNTAEVVRYAIAKGLLD